ncbi:hypothetical protein OMO38_08620 [Chryseobacterium sp. 09-1422]|uniref:RING-type E3 ubiquitin transferase n=1 Tax=Chryseobacterium kimseyorum TaxID=2984028 RepID=A0ABT3HY10_9FLAO|nr:hypothetical protein [Chryseobacterium kimseyorum]MCW3168590.1 hypothetical protein [Chryseobacterium kimseyorum]
MFEITIQMLPFLMVFSLGIALFHTVILSGLFELKLRPSWILFLIDPLIVAAGYFFVPQQSGLVFIGLFVSVFVLAIIAMITKGIQGVAENFRKAREAKKPLWKIVLSGFAVVIFYLAFFYFGIYSFFIIFFFIIVSSILPNNKNRFFFYQRNLPTSKIQSVAMGLAEICGKAKAIKTVVSPFSSTTCVGYIYTVDEIRESRDDDGRTSKSYREIERKQELHRFLLRDETGSIEVDPEKLDWISFSPAKERESGNQRYREFILDEKTEILMIGQAFYEEAKTIFRYDENKKLYGMAPLEFVNFANKWRPLKLRSVATLLCIALFSAFIIVAPIKISGTKLIIESVNWKENFSKNPFVFFN